MINANVLTMVSFVSKYKISVLSLCVAAIVMPAAHAQQANSAPQSIIEPQSASTAVHLPMLNPFPVQNSQARFVNTAAPVPAVIAQPKTEARIVEPVIMPAPVVAPPVNSFGRDIPMALAMGRIVPPNFSYAFAKDVDVAARLTWDSGQPWIKTLADSLVPYNYKAHVNGTHVMIVGEKSNVRPEPEVEPVFVLDPITPKELIPMPAPEKSAAAWPSKEPVFAMMPVQDVSYTQPPTPVVAKSYAQEDYGDPNQPKLDNLDFPNAITAMEAIPVVQMHPALAREPKVEDNMFWNAGHGESLRQVLQNWARRENVEFHWSSSYDYPIQANVRLEGDFEKAVSKLLSGFVKARPQPIARLHPNLPHGPAVLVVETRNVIE